MFPTQRIKKIMFKRKALYTGLFLDDKSQMRVICIIKRHIGQTLSVHKANHLTLKFKPDPDEVKALPIGTEITFEAIGYGADQKAQAVLCAVPHNLHCDNKHPHVTIALSPNIPPVYSNDLLARETFFLPRIIKLTARVGFFDGHTACFDFTGTIYEE